MGGRAIEQAMDCLQQILRLGGLGKERREAGLEGGLVRGGIRVGRQRKRWYTTRRTVRSPNARDKREAVFVRHPEVGDDRVGRTGVEGADRILTACWNLETLPRVIDLIRLVGGN